MDLSVSFHINKPKVIHETIDDEVVLIDFDSGNYYSLNKAGADIWGFIERGSTLGEIVEGITYRYQGRREDIQEATIRLLDELLEEALITSASEGQGSGDGRSERAGAAPSVNNKPAFEAPALHKYTDMQDLLLLDPIHEVEEDGWPSMKMGSSDEDG
jgi:hypothetical protein